MEKNIYLTLKKGDKVLVRATETSDHFYNECEVVEITSIFIYKGLTVMICKNRWGLIQRLTLKDIYNKVGI